MSAWQVALLVVSGVAVVVYTATHLVTGILWARRQATAPPPPGRADGSIRVVCGGRFRRGTGWSNLPLGVFSVYPDRLEMATKPFLSGLRSITVPKAGPHRIEVAETFTATQISEQVSGLAADVFSPRRAQQAIACLRQLGWLDEDPDVGAAPP